MSVTVKNRTLGRVVASVDLLGVVELEPREVREVLEWIQKSPIADNIVIRFGKMSPVKGSHVCGGQIATEIALQEAVAARFRAAIGVNPATVKAELGDLHENVGFENGVKQ